MLKSKLLCISVFVILCSLAFTACSSNQKNGSTPAATASESSASSTQSVASANTSSTQESASSSTISENDKNSEKLTVDKAEVLVNDYVTKNLLNKYSIKKLEPNQIEQKIYNKDYYYFSVLNKSDNEKAIVANDTCIAVKIADSTLWAAYPDGKFVSIENDEIYGKNKK